MQYSQVAGCRSEARPGLKGECETCGHATLAKCGPRIRHHWAHAFRQHCDPWWENETDWHRGWKALFPPSFREVCHRAEDGEIHRADIKTEKGIVVEIQHSAMSDAERISREVFYKNLVWIIDGSVFVKNFDIYHPLPDPESELGKDAVWIKAKRGMEGANRGLFIRLSEAILEDPQATKARCSGGFYCYFRDVEQELLETYIGHHQFDWVRPRSTWLDAKCPVYIDFGCPYLVRIDTYDESGLRCIRLVVKNDLVQELHLRDRMTDLFAPP